MNKPIYKTAIGLAAAAFLTVPGFTAGAQEISLADSLKAEQVYLPISTTISRSTATGASGMVAGEALEKYPTLDLFNSLTGILPGLFQTEDSGATGVRYNTPNCTLWVRGFNINTIIVDDVLITIPTQLQLNPQEIESVTLLTDIADKAKFGPDASRGTLYIKTLEGLEKGRQIKFDFEKGVDFVDRMPEWVGGTDYAKLNNLARENATTLGTGTYEPRFSEEDILAFSSRNPLDAFNPNVDWRSLMLKDSRDITKANFLIRGGGNGLKYSTNLGWANQGDIYTLGTASNYNRFNAKLRLGVTFNERLSADISFIALFTLRHSPLTSAATGNAYEFNNVLNLVNTVPAVEYPIYIDQNETTGAYNYAVSNTFGDNPYASLAERGSYTETGRTGITKATLNYDLGGFIKGLKSETQVSYNVYYSTRTGIKKDYTAFIYDPYTETTTYTAHDGTSDTDKSHFSAGYLQGLQFHEKLYHDWSGNGHSLNTSLTYYRSRLAFSMDESYHKTQNLIFSTKYGYEDKYIAEVTVNYAGSSALKKGNRYAVFPTAGLSWVASEEDFLKGSSVINYLKFRAQAGVLGYEAFGNQYYWESQYSKGGAYTFGPYSANQWFGTTPSIDVYNTTVNRYANDDLGWEKNAEASIGLDAVLFNHINLGITYYNRLRSGVVEDVTSVLPAYFGPGTIMDNYNSYSYQGLELSLNYSGKAGDFRYSVGGFLNLNQGKYVKLNTVVSDEWQNLEGKPIGAILGQEYIGRFNNADDIASSPKQGFDPEVYSGDLKYLDYNTDNVIDSHDSHIIGNSVPKLRYAVNLFLSFKNIVDLTVIGTGNAFYDVMLSNSYFWNGWGDGNYSAFVKDNINAAYPRLSYVKSNNNFQTSDFWMRDGSFFKIQNVELGVNIPLRKGNRIGISGFRVFGRGANLLTVSGIQYVDPESLNAGVSDYPLFRTVTGGIKLTF